MPRLLSWFALLLATTFLIVPATSAPFSGDDDWPRWRGPADNGMARGDAPLTWSDTEHISWKHEIPGKGNSSPVIWGDKIFITTAIPMPASAAPAPAAEGTPPAGGRGRGMQSGGAVGTDHEFVLICFNRNTGKLLWEQVAKVAAPHEGYHPRYGSYASNSPVTDGKMVYAFFGSRGIFAYDLDGKLVWQKDFPPQRMKLQFGEGAAPTLDAGTLYLKFDQERDSLLLALDARTGKELWSVPRDEQTSWSQPLVVTAGGKKQLVVSASGKVRSYDTATGKLIWEASGLGANVIPAPVSAGDMVYVMSGYQRPKLMAIRLGAEGDLTGSQSVVWTNDRGNSYTASPVLNEGKLYFITDNGMLTCLDAKTGQPYYQQQRLPKPYNFKASPVGVKDRLYLSTEEGDVVVVKMGEKYEVLATNTLNDQSFIATPAVAGGSLYLRSETTLFCIR
jgi:outer membrane protein assembly factor BamB